MNNTTLKPKSAKCLKNFRQSLFLNIAILKNKILNTNTIAKMKKFNSQVCTTKEQSKRLLDLGLKPETADMSLTVVCGAEIAQWVGELNNLGNIKVNGVGVPNEEVENIPAWSLHRLFDIMYVHCHELKACENVYDAMIKRIEKTIEHNTHNEYYFNK